MKRKTLRAIAAVMSVLFLFSCFGQYTLTAGIFDFFNSSKVTLKGDYTSKVIYDGKYLTPSQGKWVNYSGQKYWLAEIGNVQTGKVEMVALDAKQYSQFVGNKTLMDATGAQPNPNIGIWSKIKSAFKLTPKTTTSTSSSSSSASSSTAKATTSTSSTAAKVEVSQQVSNSGSSAAKSSSFMSKIKQSWDGGFNSGKTVGTKTYDGAKTGITKAGTAVKNGATSVGNGVKATGSKIGNFFKNVGSKFKSSKTTTTETATAKSSSSSSSSSSEASQSATPAKTTLAGKVKGFFKNIGTKVKGKSTSTSSEATVKAGASEASTSTAPVKNGVRTVDTGKSGVRYQDAKTGKFISKTEAMSRMGTESTSTTTTAKSGGVKSWLKNRMETIKGNAEKGYEKGRNIFKKKGTTETAKSESQEAQKSETKAEAKEAAAAGSASAAKPGYIKQGIDNVKTSLKSGLSAKNVLVFAGITTAIEVGRQLSNGERPSLAKVVKLLTSAEMVGGFGGSVLGGAAGSFFVPMLSAIPVVGGVLGALAPAIGSVAGFAFGQNFAGGLKQGRMSFGDALRAIDWFQVVGQGAGAVLGGMLGSFLGPVGSIAGSIVGGFLGAKLAGVVKGLFNRGGTTSTGTGIVNLDGASGLTQGGAIPVASYGSTGTSGNLFSTGGAAPAYQLSPDQQANSAVQKAHLNMTELHKLYATLISEGKAQEAQDILEKYNQAKAEFEKLVSEN